MRRGIRLIGRLHRDEVGGAVVETALVVPIFVVVVYWASLFYDIVQLRLKVQEAARFAAWEMTAHDLSAYHDGSTHGASFALGATMARQRTDLLYTSLHSENELEGSHPRLMVEYEYESSTIDNHKVLLTSPPADALASNLDSDIGATVTDLLGYVDDALGWVIEWLNFNQYGLVSAEVTTVLRPRLMPERLLQEEDGGFYTSLLIEATEYRLVERSALLADSWTLHYGHDTAPGLEGGYENNPYHRQVRRGHMLGLLEHTPIGQVVGMVENVRSLVGDHGILPLPTDAHLASMNYYRGETGADMTRNQLELQVGAKSTQVRFHTQPIQEVCDGFTCAYADSEYSNTLRRRGEWYMGCPQPQHTPGRCGWHDP